MMQTIQYNKKCGLSGYVVFIADIIQPLMHGDRTQYILHQLFLSPPAVVPDHESVPGISRWKGGEDGKADPSVCGCRSTCKQPFTTVI